jgi:hypothetical protein
VLLVQAVNTFSLLTTPPTLARFSLSTMDLLSLVYEMLEVCIAEFSLVRFWKLFFWTWKWLFGFWVL